ncbi:MAG: hypothetical protein SFW66_00470 [Gammaproteobacteria bacterium]|nr:hypothetical protein [Gammaproteobacteria bacterium]
MYGRMFAYYNRTYWHPVRHSRLLDMDPWASDPVCQDFVKALELYRSAETRRMFRAINRCAAQSDFQGIKQILQDNQVLLQECWAAKVEQSFRSGTCWLPLSLAFTLLDVAGITTFVTSAAKEDEVPANDVRVIGTMFFVFLAPVFIAGTYASAKKLFAKCFLPTPEQLIEKVDVLIDSQREEVRDENDLRASP